MSTSAPAFLTNVLLHLNLPPPAGRPHVTLTFAQSLDAKIAGAQGRQLILSGKQSMIMTHWMRSMHDAILVGINTVINDDPQLNVRHLPLSAATYPLPRPVILDTHLRLPVTCKLLHNLKNSIGRRPWVICAPSADSEYMQRKESLQTAGARIIELPPDDKTNSGLQIASILRALQQLGIKSVMVEGGAHVIASFIAGTTVDVLIITVAPVFVGEAGIGYQYPTTLSESGNITQKFRVVHTETIEQDTVVSLVSTLR